MATALKNAWDRLDPKLKERLEDIFYWPLWVAWDRTETQYYNLKHGIRNLIRWFPHIWWDRDWEPWHLHDLMLTKLTFMRDATAKYDDLHTDADRRVREMSICIHILNRHQNDHYLFGPGNHTTFKQDWHLLHKLLERHSRSWWF